MGAHNKPVLQQLDLTFDRGFSKPCRRLEQTFAGSPSRCDSVSSEEFNEERHQLFLHDLRERENDVIAEERLVLDANTVKLWLTLWDHVKFLGVKTSIILRRPISTENLSNSSPIHEIDTDR